VTSRNAAEERTRRPVFTLVDRVSGQRDVVPAKSADEATVRLLLDDRETESLVQRWLSLHRGVSKDKLTAYRRPLQFRQRILRKAGKEAQREIVQAVL
jgi:transposase-like protein